MLKKENRLRTKEFELVFKTGEKKFSKNFLFVKKKNQGGKKISVSVSKKIYKRAVLRNQARRKIYDLIQKNQKKIPQNFWATLIITKDILGIEREKVEKELIWLLNQ